MDQRYGITRLLFNQSLGCPVAFTEMIRRYGLMTQAERSTFIASLDMGETGAMVYTTAKYASPFAQLVMAFNGLNIDVSDRFTVDLATHAATMFNMTLDQMLSNDPPAQLVKSGAEYHAKHVR